VEAVWIALWLTNAAIFVWYATRRGYGLWPTLLVAIFMGPFIWAGWAFLRYGQRRGEEMAERRPRRFSDPQ